MMLSLSLSRYGSKASRPSDRARPAGATAARVLHSILPWLRLRCQMSLRPVRGFQLALIFTITNGGCAGCSRRGRRRQENGPAASRIAQSTRKATRGGRALGRQNPPMSQRRGNERLGDLSSRRARFTWQQHQLRQLGDLIRRGLGRPAMLRCSGL